MEDLARISFFLLLLSISSLLSVAGLEFHVGGPRGWVVPAAVDDPEYYNRWAMRERFHVGDSLYFKYKNDSVAVVDREAYGECSAADPLVLFDNGNTTFRFDRYGFFYFISGASGHCEAGQRLIVRVMVHPATSGASGSPAPAPVTGGSSNSGTGSGSGSGSVPAKSDSPRPIREGLGMLIETLLAVLLLV
ncbi:early nodulin-like protein 5 [Curcuma longa]|uniref:early nodulin-like protein 5 n=1 Tax=Curcuma longa TaxID=136217 RepID=UPI003D9ED8EE